MVSQQVYAVTPASVHGSQISDELQDQSEAPEDGYRRAVYDGSAYRFHDQEHKRDVKAINEVLMVNHREGVPMEA